MGNLERALAYDIHELLNIRLNVTGVTDMLKWLKENDDKGKKTGVYNTHLLISIRGLISTCAIKIDKLKVHIDKMRALTKSRNLYNMKELSECLGISRQTLYNWRDEGWLVMEVGKVHLPRTIELWKRGAVETLLRGLLFKGVFLVVETDAAVLPHI